jgi:hypothetical protein
VKSPPDAQLFLAPGERPVPPAGIVFLALYLIAGTIVCAIALIQMWPHPTPVGPEPKEPPANAAVEFAKEQELSKTYLDARCGVRQPSLDANGNQKKDANNRLLYIYNDCRHCEETAHLLRSHFRINPRENDPECVRVLWIDAVLWNERRLALIVILCGAIGGFLYAIRSFFWYVGIRKLVQSWIPIYVFAPFTSALLATIFYLVVRGGFFSGNSTVSDTSPYMFAAFGALVGLFHREAAEKLREIAETVFKTAATGTDSANYPKPTLTEVTSNPTPLSRTQVSLLTLIGDGFICDSVVSLEGVKLKAAPHRISAKELRIDVDPSELPALGATVSVTVTNPTPGGGTSDAITIAIEPLTSPP